MSSDVDCVLQAYDAFAAADVPRLRRVIAPGSVWHVGGRSGVSGTYRGREEVLRFLAQLVARTEGTFSAQVLACGELAPGLVAALVRVRAGEGESAVDTRVVQLFSVRDGVSREQWTFAEDQYLLDGAFSPATISLLDAPAPRASAEAGSGHAHTKRV